MKILALLVLASQLSIVNLYSAAAATEPTELTPMQIAGTYRSKVMEYISKEDSLCINYGFEEAEVLAIFWSRDKSYKSDILNMENPVLHRQGSYYLRPFKCSHYECEKRERYKCNTEEVEKKIEEIDRFMAFVGNSENCAPSRLIRPECRYSVFRNFRYSESKESAERKRRIDERQEVVDAAELAASIKAKAIEEASKIKEDAERGASAARVELLKQDRQLKHREETVKIREGARRGWTGLDVALAGASGTSAGIAVSLVYHNRRAIAAVASKAAGSCTLS